MLTSNSYHKEYIHVVPQTPPNFCILRFIKIPKLVSKLMGWGGEGRGR